MVHPLILEIILLIFSLCLIVSLKSPGKRTLLLDIEERRIGRTRLGMFETIEGLFETRGEKRIVNFPTVRNHLEPITIRRGQR